MGAGVDVDSITKNTQAFIATANVTAEGNILVDAFSSESLTSVTASVGISGNVAVAGSAGVYVLNITTRAWIGDDPSNPTAGATNVQAGGSILVSRLEQTLLDLLSGDFSGAGETTVGAAAGVPVITKTTEAFIGAGANVAALGLGSAIQADNGRFNISYAPYGTAVGVVQPDWQNSNLGGNSGTDLTANPSPRIGEERIATPETQSVNGLAVTAVNSDAIQGVGVDGGVSGSVAVNLSGSVGVLTNHTDAYIGGGASVNSQQLWRRHQTVGPGRRRKRHLIPGYRRGTLDLGRGQRHAGSRRARAQQHDHGGHRRRRLGYRRRRHCGPGTLQRRHPLDRRQRRRRRRSRGRRVRSHTSV